jgi:hypothetical protein
MLLSTPSLRRTTTLRGLVLGMEQERSSTWRLLKTVTAMDVVYALKRQGRTLYGFEEMGFVGVWMWCMPLRGREGPCMVLRKWVLWGWVCGLYW